jgi:hypothetical protein
MSNRIKKDRRIATQTQEPLEYSFMAVRQGPLPPPAEMEKFEALYPGVTKLVFDNFIRQSNHRMTLETTVIEGDNKRANIGQIVSAALAFLGIITGSILTYLGKDVVALSLIFTSIGTLLTAFYGGAILRKFEREKKDRR